MRDRTICADKPADPKSVIAWLQACAGDGGVGTVEVTRSLFAVAAAQVDFLRKRLDRVWSTGAYVRERELLVALESSDESQRPEADAVAEHIAEMSRRSLELARVEAAIEKVLGRPGVPVVAVGNPSDVADRNYARGFNAALAKLRDALRDEPEVQP